MSAESILLAHLDESEIGHQKRFLPRGIEIKFEIILGRDERELMIVDPYRVTIETDYIFVDSWNEGEGLSAPPDWKHWALIPVRDFRHYEQWQKLMRRIANATVQNP